MILMKTSVTKKDRVPVAGMVAVSNMKIVPTSTSASVCQGGTAPLLLKWHLLFPILVPVSLEICTVGIPLFTVALFLSNYSLATLMFIITIHLFILRVYQILTTIIGQHKNPTWNKWQAVNAWNVPSAFSVRLGLESSLCAAVRAETFQGYKSLPSKSFRKIRSWFEQNTTSAPTIWWNSVNNISYALMIIMVKGAFYECVKSKGLGYEC